MPRSLETQPGPSGGEVLIREGSVELEGNLLLPPSPGGLVLFAHGSGSSRHSARNRRVAERLRAAGLGVLLFDLLTLEEERSDEVDAHLRFDIGFLAERLLAATRWVQGRAPTAGLCTGYFGGSTGAAAALIAAAMATDRIGAIVSRGGRPDLAGEALDSVRAPTLLIVGGNDAPVIALNELAFAQLRIVKRLEIVPGATHLFPEAGALERVAELAAGWFEANLLPESWHP
jgi:pimeloyl-ACP methyl ester carboxylesterase